MPRPHACRKVGVGLGSLKVPRSPTDEGIVRKGCVPMRYLLAILAMCAVACGGSSFSSQEPPLPDSGHEEASAPPTVDAGPGEAEAAAPEIPCYVNQPGYPGCSPGWTCSCSKVSGTTWCQCDAPTVDASYPVTPDAGAMEAAVPDGSSDCCATNCLTPYNTCVYDTAPDASTHQCCLNLEFCGIDLCGGSCATTACH